MSNLENTIVEDAFKYPQNIQKLLLKLDKIKALQQEQQKLSDVIKSEVKGFEKGIFKYFSKLSKSSAKLNKRKPCGFAVPTKVTDELCVFMEREKGTFISRTEATKYLMKYISNNNLQNPENKRFIIPDAKLDSLLGETSRNTDITHFTIQRYINLHFIKKTAETVEEVSAVV
jgi:hypothetical protein